MITRALLACLVAVSFETAAQQQSGGGGYRGPSSEQPVLTPEQTARLAVTDALQTAIVKKDADSVRRLVARGDKVDFNFDEAYRGRSSESPLTMAIGRGHLEIARILLDAGADPNRRDGFGVLPIRRARSEEAIALLRRYGADVSAVDQSPSTTLSPSQTVWNVINRGDDAAAVKLLIEKGADPSALFGRETLLERALFRKRWRSVRQLVDAGAKLQPSDGAPCAQNMRECHSIEAARLATLDPPTLAYLKAHGLDVDRVATSGLTALTSLLLEPPPMRVVAVRPDGSLGPALEPPAELPRIRALLEVGADPNRRLREYTPLMIAMVVPHKPPALADALVEFGGRVDFEYTIVKSSADKPAGAYTCGRPDGRDCNPRRAACPRRERCAARAHRRPANLARAPPARRPRRAHTRARTQARGLRPLPHLLRGGTRGMESRHECACVHA